MAIFDNTYITRGRRGKRVGGVGIPLASSVEYPYFTGGTITEPGDGYRYHTFNSSGTLTVVTPGAVEFLVVGGGGSAGIGNFAGGGGGGKAVSGTATITTNQTVTVGAGANSAANPGNNSTFNGVTAGGGGGGTTAALGGGGGASGGTAGAGNNATAGTTAGGTAVTGGFAGGNGSGGSGGGGAGSGEAGNTDGQMHGGDGTEWPVGSGQYYGGGGQGHNAGSSPSNVGGLGGGGDMYTDGTNGRGGGGGGTSIIGTGWRGGSGTVIVRYLTNGSGGFNPLVSVPGLTSWWDPSDTSTITFSGSPARVLTLADKSGKSNTLVPAASGPRTNSYTQNGLNILYFDAVSLQKTGWSTDVRTSKAMTVFMVMTDGDSANKAKLAINGITNQDHQTLVWDRVNSTVQSVSIGDGATYASGADLVTLQATSFAVNANVRLYTLRINTSGVDLRVNGSTVTLGVSNGTMPYANWLASVPANWDIGVGRRYHSSGSAPLNDRVGEIIISSQYLTGTTLTDTESYLIAKWGL